MSGTTGTADNAKASRQSKNVPIDDNLQMVRNRLADLHSRLDSLKESYAGEPSAIANKTQEVPSPPPRPMLLLVNELPGDLVSVADQIGNAIEKVIQLQDMIL